MGWLHFVDKSQYYRVQFVREAQEIGIARRVPLDTLKRMEWGDMVTCVMENGEAGVKSPVMFLEFPISHVTGIGAWAVAQFLDMYPCRVLDVGGDLVKRKTCYYATGLSYRVDASLRAVAEYLENLAAEDGADIGFPMVGCNKGEVSLVKRPFPYFRGLTASPGFTRFDSDKLHKAIQGWRSQGKRPQLSSSFKLKEFDKSISGGLDFEGEIRGIRNYTERVSMDDMIDQLSQS